MRHFIEKLTRTHIFRDLPRGIDQLHDIRTSLPRLDVDIVFDVGANTGESAARFLGWFPRSVVYCFEPVSETFQQLERRYGQNRRAHLFRFALGAERTRGCIVLHGTPDMFFLEGAQGPLQRRDDLPREEVTVETLDAFCHDAAVERVAYLKIDTEGGDLQVLEGAKDLLRDHRIDLVQAEAGMNCRNDRHVPFARLQEFLEARNYFLFAVYEQVNEWPRHEPHLRRADVLFISEKVIRDNSPVTVATV